MRHLAFQKRAAVKRILDLLSICLGFFLAFDLRYEFSPPSPNMRKFFLVLPAIMLLFLVVNELLGIYSGKWKFASFEEIWALARAVFFSTTVLFLIVLVVPQTRNYTPLSVTALGGPLAFLLILANRLAYRLVREPGRNSQHGSSVRVLLVGAGSAGEMVASDMLHHQEYGYFPVAFVDDNPHNRNLVLKSVAVRGTRKDIPHLVQRLRIDMIFITIPTAKGPDLRDILGICEKTSAELRILPAISQIIEGGVGFGSMRELRIEDLLGREPVRIDTTAISQQLEGKVVLVTGAGGSIGSELSRQLLRIGPQLLVALDNDETALYNLGRELARISGNFETVVADIRDHSRINAIFEKYTPHLVFHSAAMKHVPLMESNPCEAVKINVLGTLNLAAAAAAVQAERFLLISTDKAVLPTNVMGATKRVAEFIMKMKNLENGTAFGAVRFGNVLGSRGSVVPTFMDQINCGGPVEVTHPDATRFFMTINEAVQLVIQSSTYMNGGEVFVLDMGEPIRIGELAEKMIGMVGNGQKIDIKVVGLRPGEKLHEELFYHFEELVPTDHPKINLGFDTVEDFGDLSGGIFRLVAYSYQEMETEARELLMHLVSLPRQSSISTGSPPLDVAELR